MYLEINSTSKETVIESFRRIAKELFTNYKLIVNETEYRFLDLEFYYHSKQNFPDIYAHKHKHQLTNGKWYSHGSGMDITFGDEKNHGGILVRAMAEIDKTASKDSFFIKNEIHGPLNVKAEIFSKLNGAFDTTPNIFFLANVIRDLQGALMPEPRHVVETTRINLNPDKDNSANKYYFNGKFRYVVFPNFKLKNKTQIAKDMQNQYSLTPEEVNGFMGSKFI